ncbi:hypothetical protein C6A77_12585 [Pseudomonas sp. AFG_SD02_1510_Pfu_092]|nr:hypothetical protein C6A77_12585 [Pseudomonas sp. AFG_SD02_1510_Pfu_092]
MAGGYLPRPYRRQASSHRYCTGLTGSGEPVGAGLPAIGPGQGDAVCARKSVYHRRLFAWLARTP